MKKSIFAILALSAFMFAGCEEEQTYTRIFEEAEMTLSKTEASVSEAGTSDAVTVQTAETAIDVMVDYAYINWLGATLSGNTITITAIADNPTVNERKGTVSVIAGTNGKTVQQYITVTQAGADPAKIPALSVDPAAVTLSNKSGDSKTVAITTNQSPVSVSVAAAGTEWISATTDGSNVTISSIQANPGTSARTSFVTVKAGSLTADITVTQEAGSPYAIGSKYGTDGMIAYVDEENKTLLVITLKQTIGAFSTVLTSTGFNDKELESGKEATAAIQKLENYSAENYPAIAWIVSQGSEWYLPSLVELRLVSAGVKSIDADGGLTTINQKLTEAGGDPFSIGTYYLTVVEASANNEYMIRLAKDGDNSNSEGNYKKSGATRGIRGVKVVSYAK